MKKISLTTLLCIALLFPLFAQTPDPGVRGSHTVVRESYDMGNNAYTPLGFPASVEVRASVHYPSDIGNGPYPILVFLHGRHSTCYNGTASYLEWPCTSPRKEIPSYEGYDYLADFMASHGYIVVSIGANGISANDNSPSDYGMNARARLIQYHLDLWKNYNSAGGTPFGTKFVGAVDLKRVGTMGHSRGGEGVIVHGEFNKTQPNVYGLKVVLSVGPTDYTRPKLNGVPVVSLLPYCDGDEPNLGGLHYYDDARYSDPNDETDKHTLLMMGGNHNYFNTKWTPGLFAAGTSDDWVLMDAQNDDSECGVNTNGNGRINDVTQRAAFISYASAVFRYYVGGEKQFAPILEGDDRQPPVSSKLTIDQVYFSLHPGKSKRFDINRIDTENTETLNTVGGAVSQNSLVLYDVCGDDVSELFCVVADKLQEPHNHSYVTNKVGLSQLKMQWDAPGDWYENQVPASAKDFSKYKNLQFRAGVNFVSSTVGQNLDFSVELKDGQGITHTEKVSDHSLALFYAPGNTTNVLPRVLHNMVKIPLSEFSSVNLTNVTSIKFIFNQSAKGAIMISDLMLSGPTNLSTNVSETSTSSEKLFLYPNPANSTLFIGGNNENISYGIYNCLGAEISIGKGNMIDISQLAPGVYVLRSGNYWGRFVKK